MWHQNKHLSAKERLLSRNTKMADLLLEIKREHAILFEEQNEVNSFFFFNYMLEILVRYLGKI
jgi:hypothetical protein